MLYNSLNNASVAGQYWAQGDLASDPRDANIARLSAVMYGAEAAGGLLGPFGVVPLKPGGVSGVPARSTLSDNMLADGELITNRPSGASELQRPVRAFHQGKEIDPMAARINPELAEGFVGPVDPHKIFRRVESPSQSAQTSQRISVTGELWGHGNYGSDVPTASAFRGFIPEGQHGIEFVTPIHPGNSVNPRVNGQVNWANGPGVRSFSDANGRPTVALPVIVIRSTRNP